MKRTHYNVNDEEQIDYRLYILNEHNIYITTKYIEAILKKYGIIYKVKNLDQYQKAMIHKSYQIHDDNYWNTHRSKNMNKDLEPIDDPSKAIPLQKESYERLEFLGDAIIHAILAEYIFKRYDSEQEGFMTRLRTKIENGDTLAELTKIMNLEKYILISRYIEKNGGRYNNKNILEDTFEAFIGALFLDGGFDICKKFIIKLIEDVIDFAQLLYKETNFKDLLLQHCHRKKWFDPEYGTYDISGPAHKKMFTEYVMIKTDINDEGEVTIGFGSSKKKGEQDAAKNALIKQGIIKDDNDSDSDTMEEYSIEES